MYESNITWHIKTKHEQGCKEIPCCQWSVVTSPRRTSQYANNLYKIVHLAILLCIFFITTHHFGPCGKINYETDRFIVER